MQSLTLITVFAAGLLSFASPCVLPLLPVYATILANADEKNKWHILINSSCFFAGFTIVFIIMGASATYLGQIFMENYLLLRKFGGGFMVLMGLYISGIIKIPFFLREYRPLLGRTFKGPAGAFFLGIAFTLGWTPCIGPILASILVYAGTAETLWQGAYLLFIYSLGFCLPFLAATTLITLNKRFPKYKKWYDYLPLIQQLSGVILIIIGILIYFDFVNKLIGVLWNLWS